MVQVEFGKKEDKNLTIELNKNNLITCQIHTLGQGQIAQLEFLAEVTELKGVNNSINIFCKYICK